MLIAELQRRQSEGQTDRDKLRQMVSQQEDIAKIDPSNRINLQPTMNFYDQMNPGSNISRGYEPQESSLQALRKALNYRQQLPKDDPIQALKALTSLEMADNKANAPSKMSGETMKRLGSARVAAQALKDVEDALGEGSSILPEFMTGATGDTKFTEASRRFAEGFGRMQSGAAITSDEEVRFKRLLPRFQDSPEIRQMKLQRLKEEIGARMSEMGGSNVMNQINSQQAPSDGSVDFSTMSDEQLKKIIGR